MGILLNPEIAVAIVFPHPARSLNPLHRPWFLQGMGGEALALEID